MTSTTALPATGTVPVIEGVRRVHHVLDSVEPGPIHGPVTGPDIASVDRAIARLESMKLSMVAAADRGGVATTAGMTGTPAWLAAHTRSWGGKAAADVSLATALDTSLPATKEALAAGEVSTAHAAVIAGTTSRLPESLTPTEVTRIERSLVAQAKRVDPARLRRAGRRALLAAERTAEEALAHEDAELRGEEQRAEATVRLTMHDNHDGTVTGHFTVPTLAGAILRKTVQQLASPRRAALRAAGGGGLDGAQAAASGAHTCVDGARATIDRLGAAAEGSQHSTVGQATVVGQAGPAAGSRGRLAEGGDWAQRYGAAFVELLEHLPTDRLHGKVAATVVVTIDHDRLREGVGAAHLDTGHDLSASETRRVACNAGILPAVLSGGSLPLDLGRSNRFFSEAQRVALATAYDECAADGCDRPYAWSELHHEDPWAKGGATDLDLAVPLCRWHHARVHDPRYEHRVTSDARHRKSVTLHRRP
ncbi:MAG: DUF222 domain-containing protein [Ornithinibacter sp.]